MPGGIAPLFLSVSSDARIVFLQIKDLTFSS